MCNSRRPSHTFLLWAVVVTAAAVAGHSQTPTTGALVGVALDSSEALLQGASVSLTNQDTGERLSTSSDSQGRFGFLLLAPGRYELCAGRAEFAEVCSSGINVNVTETRRIDLRFRWQRL
jgi:hypothetical protein